MFPTTDSGQDGNTTMLENALLSPVSCLRCIISLHEENNLTDEDSTAVPFCVYSPDQLGRCIRCDQKDAQCHQFPDMIAAMEYQSKVEECYEKLTPSSMKAMVQAAEGLFHQWSALSAKNGADDTSPLPKPMSAIFQLAQSERSPRVVGEQEPLGGYKAMTQDSIELIDESLPSEYAINIPRPAIKPSNDGSLPGSLVQRLCATVEALSRKVEAMHENQNQMLRGREPFANSAQYSATFPGMTHSKHGQTSGQNDTTGQSWVGGLIQNQIHPGSHQNTLRLHGEHEITSLLDPRFLDITEQIAEVRSGISNFWDIFKALHGLTSLPSLFASHEREDKGLSMAEFMPKFRAEISSAVKNGVNMEPDFENEANRAFSPYNPVVTRHIRKLCGNMQLQTEAAEFEEPTPEYLTAEEDQHLHREQRQELPRNIGGSSSSLPGMAHSQYELNPAKDRPQHSLPPTGSMFFDVLPGRRGPSLPVLGTSPEVRRNLAGGNFDQTVVNISSSGPDNHVSIGRTPDSTFAGTVPSISHSELDKSSNLSIGQNPGIDSASRGGLVDPAIRSGGHSKADGPKAKALARSDYSQSYGPSTINEVDKASSENWQKRQKIKDSERSEKPLPEHDFSMSTGDIRQHLHIESQRRQGPPVPSHQDWAVNRASPDRYDTTSSETVDGPDGSSASAFLKRKRTEVESSDRTGEPDVILTIRRPS